MSTESLEQSDKAAAEVQKTPNRVTLDYIKSLVEEREFYCPSLAPHFTFCMIKLKNGYVVTGQASPADPQNYNFEMGCDFSFEDALRKVWDLEGYLLCEKLKEDS